MSGETERGVTACNCPIDVDFVEEMASVMHMDIGHRGTLFCPLPENQHRPGKNSTCRFSHFGNSGN